MTFLSGFAEGFTTARKDRLDREAELENTKFKYGMDALVQKRELRDKKKAQETEWASQAKMLGEQYGDKNASTGFYKELSSGVPVTTIQERIAKREYEKNDKYVAPSTTVRVPIGVETERYDEGMGFDEKITARIDEIDPTLRTGTKEYNEFSTLTDDAASPVIYRSKEKLEFGSFAEELAGLTAAENSGDEAQIRAAQDRVQAHKDAIVFQESTKSSPRPIYAIRDKNGAIVDKMVGEIRPTGPNGAGELWNVGNPLQAERVDLKGGSPVEISPEQNKAWFEVNQNVSKKVKDYDTRVNKYVAASQTSFMIKGIVQETPEVLEEVGPSLADFAQRVGKEFGTAIQMVDNQVSKTENAFASGDANAVANEMRALDDSIADMGKQIELAPPNEKIVLQKARYKALMESASFQLAAANGVEGRDLSKNELESFRSQLKGNTLPELFANLDNANKTVLSSLMSEEHALQNDNEVEWLKQELGVTDIKGTTPRRIGEAMAVINPELLKDLNRFRKEIHDGATTAAATVDPRIAKPEQKKQPSVLPGVGGKKFTYVGPQPMTEEDRKNKSNWKEVGK